MTPRERDPVPLPLSIRSALLTALAPLLLSFAAGVTCYVVLGVTTGLFFAAVVVVALIAPPLVLNCRDRMRQTVVWSSVVDGAACALLPAVTDPYVTLLDWVRAYLLLAAFALALWGVARLLVRAKFPPVLASAATVVLALAWLAWPVWLSPWLAGRETLVSWLVPAHPLLALDGALRHLDRPWSEHHLMYTRLSVLNPDVAYSLPPGVGGAVLFHAALGLACLLPYRRLLARGKK